MRRIHLRHAGIKVESRSGHGFGHPHATFNAQRTAFIAVKVAPRDALPVELTRYDIELRFAFKLPSDSLESGFIALMENQVVVIAAGAKERLAAIAKAIELQSDHRFVPSARALDVGNVQCNVTEFPIAD